MGMPRFEYPGEEHQNVVNLKKMDEQLHAASDKSIIRPGFAGLPGGCWNSQPSIIIL
jgi:hypothetical protein